MGKKEPFDNREQLFLSLSPVMNSGSINRAMIQVLAWLPMSCSVFLLLGFSDIDTKVHFHLAK